MRWIALPAGIVLVLFTLIDVFRTLVMPRAATGRLRVARLVFRALWRPWRWLGVRSKTDRGRERILSTAAPAFLFVFLAAWAGLAVVGYGLILWSPAFSHGVHGAGAGSFSTALYFSGSSLFTIGFGDVVATGLTRGVVVLEGATGLGLVAVVIAYLPVLYQAFNRREVGVLLLDARAGSPASGPELIRRSLRHGAEGSLSSLFQEWERWAADVLETHLSYPLLALFRSPHDNTSWVTSLGAVLDAATLKLAIIDEGHFHDAEMLYATANHAVEDLFYFFGQPERHVVIERAEFDEVMADLAELGVRLRPADQAWKKFHELRDAYAGRLDAIATLIAAPPAQWIGDRSSLVAPPEKERGPRH